MFTLTGVVAVDTDGVVAVDTVDTIKVSKI